MTKDDVLKLAIEADLVEPRDIDNDVCELPEDYVASLVAFAALVAAHEREACLNCYSPDDTATDWADKIRARGQE
jgi:hypothetical protein